VPDILWSVREDPSDGVRRAAFRAFEAIGPAAAEAAPELIRAARNPKDPARTEALWALGGVRPRAELLDPIMAMARDTTEGRPGRRDDQSQAMRALTRHDPLVGRTMPLIRVAQFSDYAVIRVEATTALVRADEVPLERLLDAWTDTYDPEESYPVLPQWLRAIESLGPRAGEAVPRLMTLLAEPIDRYEESYQWQAARALGAPGPPASAALPRLRELPARNDLTAPQAATAIRRIEGTKP
jgi:HEAT repeat protein